jgi:acetylornithine deacetylase/succinyl-diaminopimelate desuccinylase-like protein
MKNILEEVKVYLQQERPRHIEELLDFVSIPSISSSTKHKTHMKEAAEWLKEKMESAGLEHVEIMETQGHPVIYGDWLHAPDKPTALVYGHYDVQSAEPLDLWNHPPFDPEIVDNKLYGRGATDDKGQLYIHIKTVEALLQIHNKLPVNIKFCIEGEEEVASPNLQLFIEAHLDKLKSDLIVISDGPMHDKDQPSICSGLRGLCALEIEVKGANTDLHSGLYGGGIANPAFSLVQLLATMHDQQGKIAVNGFYDDVNPLAEAERNEMRALKFDEDKLCEELGLEDLYGEQGYTFIERTSVRPTLEINGIYGGYQGEDIKTIVPSTATAKISCRLVDRQNPETILKLIKEHIRTNSPKGVQVEVRPLHGGKPYVISPEHPYMLSAKLAFEHGFGKPPVFIRSGGSIPIVEAFAALLKAPVIMMDFGLPGENLHAPNEHFHLVNFDKGIATVCAFLNEIGKPNELEE